MRRRFATWVWVALIALTLQGSVWAQSPTAASSAAPASPAAVASAAPASAAPAAVTSSAPATAAPAAVASAAPASGAPASGLPAVSGSPGTAATTNPAPALPQITEIQPPTAQEIHPKSVARSIIEGILLVAYFILSLALIVCVMFTNTKNEGLTGIIGGGSTASPVFKGKKSAEETLAHWTARLSWAFLFSSLGIWLIMSGG